MLPSFAVALALSTTDAVTLEAAFARWEATAREMKSLHVEYTTERTFAGQKDTTSCTLRMLRTDDGLFADLVMRAGDESGRYLLREGTLYAIDPTKKQATRFKTGDVTQYVADHYQPLAVLLDRSRAEKSFDLAVAKRDDWFTFLTLTPKDKTANLPGGMVVVPHRKNDTLPVGMPRVLRYTNEVGITVDWDVTKWVMNGDNPPKASEFELPAEKDGWTISEWEWPPKWKGK